MSVCVCVFRDILQRVSDVMYIFGVMHVADAVAVRNMLTVMNISDRYVTNKCDLTKPLFGIHRV